MTTKMKVQKFIVEVLVQDPEVLTRAQANAKVTAALDKHWGYVDAEHTPKPEARMARVRKVDTD